MRVHDNPAQRSVLGSDDARAVLVRGERGRAADEPREQRGAVRAHHAHAACAGAGHAPPATRVPLRITRPAAHSRTRTAPRASSSSHTFLTRPRTLTLHCVTHSLCATVSQQKLYKKHLPESLFCCTNDTFPNVNHLFNL